MSIAQTTSNVINGNFVIKRQRVTFTEEKSVFLPLNGFLAVPTNFPTPWNPSPTWTQSQYVANHPMNKARFTLAITSATLLKLPVAHKDGNIPTYQIGRVLLGTGTTPATFGLTAVDYPRYASQYLFEKTEYPLETVQNATPILTVAMEFFTAISGTLTILNELYYPPPT